MVCHSLLQWTTFCHTSPPRPACLGWPHKAWLSFIELDKAVIRVIRLTSFLLLWFQCVCPLMPSCNTYHLTWVCLTLDVGYLFTSKVRGGGCEELPHARGQGPWLRGATPHPRSGGCAGVGGLRGATPRSRSGRAAVRRYPSSKVRNSDCTLLEQP